MQGEQPGGGREGTGQTEIVASEWADGVRGVCEGSLVMTRPGCGCGCEWLNLLSQQGCRRQSGAFQATRGGGPASETSAKASQSSVRCVGSQPYPRGVGVGGGKEPEGGTVRGWDAGQGWVTLPQGAGPRPPMSLRASLPKCEFRTHLCYRERILAEPQC